jgi:hypothetical protein
MKPLKLPAVHLPARSIDYPTEWQPGTIEIYSRLPMAMLMSFEQHLKQFGWQVNADAVTRYHHDITMVNGSAYVHKDEDYGIMAIALIDSVFCEAELVTRYGGTRMKLGDVVVFDTDKWHAWISHGPCALAGVCAAPIPPPTPTEP